MFLRVAADRIFQQNITAVFDYRKIDAAEDGKRKGSRGLKTICTDLCNNTFKDRFTEHTDDKPNEQYLLGEHENQVSEGGEADLHKHRNNCKKNPGHPYFIPVDLFSLKDLPECHQNIDLYNVIKASADLTVKINVYKTSPNRPEFWPNTKIPYFLSNMRGKKTLRTATGTIHEVIRHTIAEDLRNYTTCPCDKCKAPNNPSKVWWEIKVRTAAHVVVDDIEASHTTIKLFYDREDSEVVLLKDNVRVYNINIENDWCGLSCVTCDELLGMKLEEVKKRFDEARKKIKNKYSNCCNTDKFNFMVSHPHGCSKQVSVGQWKDKVLLGYSEHDYKLTYSTCTCPGSSGASVYSLGDTRWFSYIHSGSLRSGLNYSSDYSTLFFPFSCPLIAVCVVAKALLTSETSNFLMW